MVGQGGLTAYNKRSQTKLEADDGGAHITKFKTLEQKRADSAPFAHDAT